MNSISGYSRFQLELIGYAEKVFPLVTDDQIEDLLYLAWHRQSGLCASRGYGKTLLVLIYDTFMALRGWKVTHAAKEMSQFAQVYEWARLLGWSSTQWRLYRGNVIISLRLYSQGRGPRVDVLSCDEVGTVVTELEQRHFAQSQEMLSGSRLGKALYIGTQDPNSVWSRMLNTRVRGYAEKIMPWVKTAYESARRWRPQWYMDQEFHCKATAAGGAVLGRLISSPDCNIATQRYGIDSNPAEGYFIVGSAIVGDKIVITEAMRFGELKEIADFIWMRKSIPFELEMNGPGAVVGQYLRESHLGFIEDWVSEQSKIDRISRIASVEIVVPLKFGEVYLNLGKQIWGSDKKIIKFADAHWFDAFWHSVGSLGNPITFFAESSEQEYLNGSGLF